MKKTTYELQADFMAEKYGVQTAIKEARGFAKKKSGAGAVFWNNVIFYLERIAAREKKAHDVHRD